MNKCYIIGLSDSHRLCLTPEVMKIISAGRVFSGGMRHHEIIASMLPTRYVWINITIPITDVLEKYKHHDELVIFASGDPLFYGFANTVKRSFPEVQMKVFPTFNSLQLLAHKLNLAYNDMYTASLTGRPWDRLDEALIRGERLIGCLTDKNKTPHEIWQRMHTYGYDNYEMYVGENLGNEEKENFGQYNPAKGYSTPNCIILEQRKLIRQNIGIPDEAFHLLDGRSRMITKMPVRMASLSALQLAEKKSFWDIGFCTGSVSIEAKLAYPHLKVTAFEIRDEGKELMLANSRKFHAPGIDARIGDFCNMDISDCPLPDAVFIGGYGGKMKEVLIKVKNVLSHSGCIVFNSVSETSKDSFFSITKELGMTTEILHTITVDGNNPIIIMRAI
ncbi:precorrin-6y C5,15-methyltransferase (decarboxylating) subunit CbiE [uncultured Prevotella sp.]|uniref:precorrin-6y C5,15-methyltransferase (decarboxylating) subunit CbiE n=1 Tax=uncultured Prevotella sp. TaxID=159272 RepID=UPI0025847D7C|nr:precorrin-6y C5,15-methyltransferase (decarboxylating) subunit CbiE [uncultured Prevotella sp.]